MAGNRVRAPSKITPPLEENAARTRLLVVAWMDAILVVGVLLAILINVRNAYNNVLYLFQTPHVFMAITGTILGLNQRRWISGAGLVTFYLIMAGLALVFDASSVVLRIRNLEDLASRPPADMVDAYIWQTRVALIFIITFLVVDALAVVLGYLLRRIVRRTDTLYERTLSAREFARLKGIPIDDDPASTSSGDQMTSGVFRRSLRKAEQHRQ